MKFSGTLLWAALGVLIISCGGNRKNTNPVFRVDSQLSVIDSLEKKRDPSKNMDPKLADKLIVEYTRFIDSFPDHDKAPDFLFEKNLIYYGMRKYKEQAQCLRDLIEKYPDFKRSDECYYMLAHIMDSEFDERSEAKKFYGELLEKYPRSIFAPDCRSRLETIDSLSFNQLIEAITAAAHADK